MSKKTPGPWMLRATGFQIEAIGERLRPVATVLTSRADARLIAAAPDLLTALVRLLHTMEPDHSSKWAEGSEVEQARAAIAKATGETP